MGRACRSEHRWARFQEIGFLRDTYALQPPLRKEKKKRLEKCQYQSGRPRVLRRAHAEASGRQLLPLLQHAHSANSQSCNTLPAQPAVHITVARY